MQEPKWLQLEAVLAGHEQVMREHGGQGGLLKPAELDSALSRPKNIWAYSKASLHELAAAYAKGITQNHPFNDGNKRASLMAAYTFLRINGQKLTASESEAVHMTVGLASSEVSEEGYTRWLEANTVALKPAQDAQKVEKPEKRQSKRSDKKRDFGLGR